MINGASGQVYGGGRRHALEELNKQSCITPLYCVHTRDSLDEIVLRRARLVNIDLAHAEMPRADLRHAFLVGANFKDATLARAHLERAKLTESQFTDAHMFRAHLSHAVAEAARFEGAELEHADLTSADFRYADLEATTLTGADLTGANFICAVNLSVAQIKSARHWETAIYSRAIAAELLPTRVKESRHAACSDPSRAAIDGKSGRLLGVLLG